MASRRAQAQPLTQFTFLARYWTVLVLPLAKAKLAAAQIDRSAPVPTDLSVSDVHLPSTLRQVWGSRGDARHNRNLQPTQHNETPFRHSRSWRMAADVQQRRGEDITTNLPAPDRLLQRIPSSLSVIAAIEATR